MSVIGKLAVKNWLMVAWWCCVHVQKVKMLIALNTASKIAPNFFARKIRSKWLHLTFFCAPKIASKWLYQSFFCNSMKVFIWYQSCVKIVVPKFVFAPKLRLNLCTYMVITQSSKKTCWPKILDEISEKFLCIVPNFASCVFWANCFVALMSKLKFPQGDIYEQILIQKYKPSFKNLAGDLEKWNLCFYIWIRIHLLNIFIQIYFYKFWTTLCQI